jgi:phosphoribosylformylglycinamidine synthase subunit PurQ / glutaminase
MSAKPTVCVLRAPGTNCDVETAFAFAAAGAAAERVHLFRLLEDPKRLANYQVLCIPGGFSYGDDVGAGVIFSQKLQNRLADALAEFLQRDTLLLGICNGFQVLLKAGLLPNGTDEWPPDRDAPPYVTLTWNENGKYTALWVHLRVQALHNAFLRGIDRIELPVAHAEGKLEITHADVLEDWRRRRQIALCYEPPLASDPDQTVGAGLRAGPTPVTDAPGSPDVLPFPANPNGSVANIAGLSDPTGRILGLMPHPERFIHATQHPQWTRLRLSGEGDGMKVFRNAVGYYG